MKPTGTIFLASLAFIALNISGTINASWWWLTVAPCLILVLFLAAYWRENIKEE